MSRPSVHRRRTEASPSSVRASRALVPLDLPRTALMPLDPAYAALLARQTSPTAGAKTAQAPTVPEVPELPPIPSPSQRPSPPATEEMQAFSRWLVEMLHWTSCHFCQAANLPLPGPGPLAQNALAYLVHDPNYHLMLRRMGGFLATPQMALERLHATRLVCETFAAQQQDRRDRLATLQQIGFFHADAPTG